MKIGEKIYRVYSCTSTNDLAKKMAKQGAVEGTGVAAEQQIQGKGTKGRQWISPPGKGIYVSFILYPPPQQLSLLPLVGALAVREALWQSLLLQVQLKWPNDVLWKRKKLGGILCESSFWGERLNYVILGIGLNTGHGEEDFPQDMRPSVTSLYLIRGKETERETLLQKLVQVLNTWYGCWLKGEASKIVKCFQEYSVYKTGRKLQVKANGETVSGKYLGINLQGGLILEAAGKKITFYAAQTQSLRED